MDCDSRSIYGTVMKMGEKSKILSIVFSAVAMAGCDRLRSLKSEIEASRVFDRKIKCESYASKVEQEWKQASNELAPGLTKEMSYSVERSFYSSKRNSCVCMLLILSPGQGGKMHYDVRTLDALTREELGDESFDGKEPGAWKDYIEKQVKDLQ